MEDARIYDGDLVLVYKTQAIKDGDIVVAGLNGDEATIKRYREVGVTKFLQAENKKYKDITLHEDMHPFIIGKVIKVEFDV